MSHEDRSPLQALLDAMPPVAALGVQVAHCDHQRLVLRAPLARNVNDKGCAFGGSLASLLTLAGWGVLEHALRQRGLDAEVYIADSELKYLAPLYGDLEAEAHLPGAAALEALLSKLRERGRGGIVLEATARDAAGAPVTTLRGRYAVVLKR